MITSRPLKTMPYAQAKVYENGINTILVSYQTAVAQILEGVLYVTGLYSATTRKHISAFCREYGLDYSVAKHCVETQSCYDIATKTYIKEEV